TGFVWENFTDTVLDRRSDLSCHLLEQACPILARIKIPTKNKKVKSRPLSIACTRRKTHKQLWLSVKQGERFQCEIARACEIAVVRVEVHSAPLRFSLCIRRIKRD